MKRRSAAMALTALMPLIYLILSAAVIAALSINGSYPSGEQAMFHIYRGDTVFRSLQQGALYPYYDPMWFNGTELLRFTPPLTAYALALSQALAGGNIFYGYLLFVGLNFYVSSLAWLRIGIKVERPALGAVLGLVWPFLPYNLHVFFVDGDLARALAITLVPCLFDQVQCYVQSRRWTGIPRVAVCVFLLTLTHAVFAAMAAVCIIVLLVVHGLVIRQFGGLGNLVLAVFAGFLLAGLWLVPYYGSGILSIDFHDALESSFQPLVQSLNPVYHFEMQSRTPYFGLALFLTACFACIFGQQKAVPSAWTTVVLLLLTTSAAYVVIHIIPGSQYLRMLWLFPAAAAITFFVLLFWDTLRRPLLAFLCVLLIMDIFPSLSLIAGSGQVRSSASERMDAALTTSMLDEAQAMTTHRLAILDEGNLGPETAFLATDWGMPVPIIGGDDRAYATTRNRQIQMSRALTGGQYLYVFDRCLELGCDTILLLGAVVDQEDLETGVVDAAADRLGYSLVAEDRGCYLYHADLGNDWGLVSQYSAIGIGTTAYYMSLFYPAMEETADTNLNHYTFKQLSQYDLVFLSGFTYDERDTAEELILSLSEAGVHIVIEADGIPESRQTRDRRFLGVACNEIEFANGYPELDTIDGILNTDLFPQGYTKWETVYIEGLDEVWGTIYDNGLILPFYGTVCNEDIVVIGLNLSLHYSLTKDPSVGALLSHAMFIPANRLPDRTVVPLRTEYVGQSVIFTAQEDNVNTTLAWHDFFNSESSIKNKENLLMVDSGTTVVSLSYPYFVSGLLTSLLGAVMLCALTLSCWHTARLERAEAKLFKGDAWNKEEILPQGEKEDLNGEDKLVEAERDGSEETVQ